MRRSSNGAGQTGSNVLGAMAPITASSRAAHGDCSSVTRVASRPLSKRERSSRQASCRCASGSRRSTWSRNQRRAFPVSNSVDDHGVTQTAAWMMKHKLAQVMLERNASKRLKGNVQMDDAYVGGARSGRRGGGAAGKTPFVAVIATTGTMASRSNHPSAGQSLQQLGDPNARKHCAQSLGAQYCLRRSGMLHRCHPSRMHSRLNKDLKWHSVALHLLSKMGQYRIGQHQSRPRGDLPRRTRKTRPSISRGVRISIQSPISSRNHDPPPRVRCAEDRPHALPLAQTG